MAPGQRAIDGLVEAVNAPLYDAWIEAEFNRQLGRQEEYLRAHQDDLDDPWITTASGTRLHLLQPRHHELVRWENGAAALANTCRFGGHVSRFYSVAEHSVRVHDLLRSWYRDDATCLAGLLHDWGEVGFGDCVGPLKRQPGMAWYRKAEHDMQDAVYEAAKLQVAKVPVKLADLVMLATEHQALRPRYDQTNLGADTMDIPLPDPIRLRWWDRMGWSPRKARRVLLSRLAGYGLVGGAT